MKRWFNFKYPKMAGLVIAIIFAYIIFRNPTVSHFVSNLGVEGYIGVFIAGLLFAFGFTAPFAAGFFITLNPGNIWLAGIVGGLGAVVSDTLIFKFIKFSFTKEFSRFKKISVIRKTGELIERSFGKKFKVYLMYALAGIMIASPLPDEAGVIMLAGLTKIKLGTLMKLGFILNTLGIIILLSL